VIEMVEIGAGGGSLARIDQTGRIVVGPESAGANPGPASYGRGGTTPAVTDADLVMGRIDAEAFSGGRMALDTAAAARALHDVIGEPLGLSDELAAYGVGEMVDENMANAVRVHAIESGKSIAGRTLIAFGGAAPLHAARIAEKLDIDRVVVPVNAGVGSAVGFLVAPVAYEVVRSNYQRLDGLDTGVVNAMIGAMGDEARAIVERGAPDSEHVETRIAFMRYIGQGHEIAVTLPLRELGAGDEAVIRAAFEAAYEALYQRLIPGVDIEILSWIVTVASAPQPLPPVTGNGAAFDAASDADRTLFDPASGAFLTAPVYRREALAPGARLSGPAVIVEDETSTVVTPLFDAMIDGRGAIVLTRKREGTS
jgi:N-methylhydantoinase A